MIEITKATLNDVAEMQNLVRPEVVNGIILPRSDDEVANTIRSYIVAREDGKIVGFCALYIFDTSLGEIRSLIVHSDFRGKGIGEQIITQTLKEGKELGLSRILALTYKREFFKKLGFIEVQKEEIPDQKIWMDCIKCKHFPICDEIAMTRAL